MPKHLAHIVGHNIDLFFLIWMGASTRAAIQYLEVRKNNKLYRFGDYAITILICSFTAVIFGMVSAAAGRPEIVQYISSGIGAYLGIEGLNKITMLFRGRNNDQLP